MSNTALEDYAECGMRLAHTVDMWWDALVGMRGEQQERAALTALAPVIDDYRDACSAVARASQRSEWT